jgi:hypothetical protein
MISIIFNKFCPPLLGLLLLQGCTSAPVNVFPLPPAHYQILGRVEGMGCGTQLLGFIPILFNTRVERAYQEAVGILPGTLSLIHVRVREDWFWWAIATNRCTLVTGDAIGRAKL